MSTNNPFETFQKSAFRLEVLPEYIVDEEKADYEEFKKSGAVPASENSEWVDIVKASVKNGRTMQRLRLLSEELTTYEQFEILAYPGIAYGEEIKVSSRKQHADKYKYDFWFFDDEYIAKMHYKPDGTFVKFDLQKASKDEIEMYQYWVDVFNSSELLA